MRPAAGVQVNACSLCSSVALCLSHSVPALPAAHLAAELGPQQAQVVLHGAKPF